ncbi:unnamed protein product [Caenorhabditis bovis]|uniref:Uncharacterized protein n=1 Tax=Caenorhabditis bovis TaxID=2654633 RepID=A0A8S1EKM5_9PELO|nr:unnamed protein product [Caenorhabditis bovis]
MDYFEGFGQKAVPGIMDNLATAQRTNQRRKSSENGVGKRRNLQRDLISSQRLDVVNYSNVDDPRNIHVDKASNAIWLYYNDSYEIFDEENARMHPHNFGEDLKITINDEMLRQKEREIAKNLLVNICQQLKGIPRGIRFMEKSIQFKNFNKMLLQGLAEHIIDRARISTYYAVYFLFIKVVLRNWETKIGSIEMKLLLEILKKSHEFAIQINELTKVLTSDREYLEGIMDAAQIIAMTEEERSYRAHWATAINGQERSERPIDDHMKKEIIVRIKRRSQKFKDLHKLQILKGTWKMNSNLQMPQMIEITLCRQKVKEHMVQTQKGFLRMDYRVDPTVLKRIKKEMEDGEEYGRPQNQMQNGSANDAQPRSDMTNTETSRVNEMRKNNPIDGVTRNSRFNIDNLIKKEEDPFDNSDDVKPFNNNYVSSAFGTENIADRSQSSMTRPIKPEPLLQSSSLWIPPVGVPETTISRSVNDASANIANLESQLNPPQRRPRGRPRSGPSQANAVARIATTTPQRAPKNKRKSPATSRAKKIKTETATPEEVQRNVDTVMIRTQEKLLMQALNQSGAQLSSTEHNQSLTEQKAQALLKLSAQTQQTQAQNLDLLCRMLLQNAANLAMPNTQPQLSLPPQPISSQTANHHFPQTFRPSQPAVFQSPAAETVAPLSNILLQGQIPQNGLLPQIQGRSESQASLAANLAQLQSSRLNQLQLSNLLQSWQNQSQIQQNNLIQPQPTAVTTQRPIPVKPQPKVPHESQTLGLPQPSSQSYHRDLRAHMALMNAKTQVALGNLNAAVTLARRQEEERQKMIAAANAMQLMPAPLPTTVMPAMPPPTPVPPMPFNSFLPVQTQLQPNLFGNVFPVQPPIPQLVPPPTSFPEIEIAPGLRITSYFGPSFGTMNPYNHVFMHVPKFDLSKVKQEIPSPSDTPGPARQ